MKPIRTAACCFAAMLCCSLPGALGALEVKPFSRDTVLRRAGESLVSVVAPTGRDALRNAARAVAEAVGADTQIVDEAEALDLAMEIRADLQQRHLILIGNALDNAAVMRLYNLEKAKADSYYPGPGGWIVRTLVDPWGTGKNVIIAAGSDTEGTAAAVTELVKAIEERGKQRVLPWAWRFRSGVNNAGKPLYTQRRFSEAQWEDFRETIVFDAQPIAFYPATAMSAAIQAGREYLENGGREEVQRFLMALEEVRTLGDQIETMRTLEFRLKDLVNAWELLEADPDITQAQRQQISEYLFFIGALFEDKYWNNKAPEQTQALCATTNHISNGNLGYLRLGLYLRRRCDLTPADAARADTWIANADMLFDAQDDSYRSACDANGYQWWTNKHMVMYALWRPDYDLFWNGNMRLLADILFATADNMANAARFGDVGASLTGFSSHAHYLLTHSTRAYGDGRHHWISRFLKRSSRDLKLDTPPREPVDLYGVHRVPLSRAIYLHQSRINEKPGWQAVPWTAGFDKISFRPDADPRSPYMLLDGLGGMGHGQDDCNAITRVTAKGHIWLIDAAYDLKTMYDHNGVFVARDGRGEAPADLAQITAFADLPSFGATRTESPANGLRWARHVLWDKAGYFVVIDDLTCRTAGDYQANAIWRLPVEGTLDRDRLVTRRAGETFVIASGGDGVAKTAWEGAERALGAQAFALRQVVSRKMQPHDRLTYANLLCWPEADAPAPSLRRLDTHAWEVQGLGRPRLLAVNGPVRDVIDTDATMLRMDSNSLALVNATRCVLDGATLMQADKPVNVEMRIDGAAVFLAGEPTRVQLPLAAAGGTDAAGEQARLDLPPGQTRTALDHPDSLASALQHAMKRTAEASTYAQDTEAETGEQTAPVRWRYDGVRKVNPLAVAGVTSDIPCLKGRSSPVEKLIDGSDNRSTVSAMWPPGQSPTVTFDLGKLTTLDAIEVRSWDGLSESSLGPVTLAVTTQDEPTAFRPVNAAFADPVQGERDIARSRTVTLDDVQARYVRMTFTPAAEDHRVYVSEVVFVPDPAAESVLAPVNDMVIHDLDGDGDGEVLLAGSDNRVHCLDDKGSVLWTFETGDIVQDVWAGDIDGKTTIFVGSEDQHLYRLDPDGTMLWKVQTYDYQPRRYEVGGIRCLTVASLQPGADPVVIVGADNWHLSLFTTDGEEITHCYFYSHETTFLDVGDINGDGNQEIFQGSSFAHVNWFDTHAQESHFIWNNIGPAADGVIADLDGDGKGEMIGVGQQGLAASSVETPVLWRIDTGSPQTVVAKADVNGDGVDDVVTAGKNGFLWALGENGKKHWLRNAGDSINDLIIVPHPAADTPLILTAGDDGTVTAWNADGTRATALHIGKQVSRIAAGSLDKGKDITILAMTIDGMIQALDLPKTPLQ